MAIDPQAAQPLAGQIRDDLARRIRSNELTVGQKIPSLRSLADEYEVAELTVHAAVRELQHSGALESTSGRGTFVRRVPESDEPSVAELHEQLSELQRVVAELSNRVRSIENHGDQ